MGMTLVERLQALTDRLATVEATVQELRRRLDAWREAKPETVVLNPEAEHSHRHRRREK